MKKKNYHHLFFDLDKTLWDFETNSRETLRDIYVKYGLEEKGIATFDLFAETYNRHNLKLWELYRQNGISKAVLSVKRFTLTLNEFGIFNSQTDQLMATDYVTLSPEKTALFPDTADTLKYLKINTIYTSSPMALKRFRIRSCVFPV